MLLPFFTSPLRKKRMYKCNTCNFELWNYLGQIGESHLGLYDDFRYPGRCLLVYRDHHDHLTQMSPSTAMIFMNDILKAGNLLTKALSCERMNYAILGNAEHHVHAHLIPRYGTDPVPKKSPWNHPDEATPMSDDLKKFIINNIKIRLNK